MTLRVPVLVKKPGHDEPERRSDGPLDIRASKPETTDELLDLFARMLGPRIAQTNKTAAEEAEDERLARFAADIGGLRDGFLRGDAEAIKQAVQRSMMELRADDPLFGAAGVGLPRDALAQFGVPLDTTEILTLCDETTLMRNLPEVVDDRDVVSWREMNLLQFITGSDKVAFEEGDCPESFESSGANKSVALKHLGAQAKLTESDILASRFSISRGYGMRELVGGFGPGEGGVRPGEGDVSSFIRGNITDLRSKEMMKASILTLNGLDETLVNGDAGTNPLEFDGLVDQVTAVNGARANGGTTTGTFSQTHFDQFLAAGCAYPDALIGHPSALQAISVAYLQAGTQTIFYDRNERISPGFSFSPEIITAFGPLKMIADRRFPITGNADGTITSKVYPLLTRHRGEPLVYRQTQIPLSFKDLEPGCTAIRFIIWTVTALVIKAMCAQSVYTARFPGIVDTSGCGLISPNA